MVMKSVGERAEMCTFSPNFKRDIFPKLRVAFDGVRLRVPIDVTCREDLHEMQDCVKDGQHNYFAKRTAEGHSDRCTALALAIRAAANAAMAAGYARAEQSNSYGARLAFPAQELVRIEQRDQPRDWHGRWRAAGGKFYSGRMVALKEDPIWTSISRFGNPYPPFDFNSGMGDVEEGPLLVTFYKKKSAT